MANPNSFPPPPMFNGQYAPPPYYQLYNANPQTPNGAHFPPAVQHSPALITQASNSKRFEANSNTSTPPPPLPFLFPPNTDFESLRKHFQAHGMPLPPPPLPGQAFPSTFAPSPHNAVASIPPQQPPIPTFPQSRPPFPPIPSAAATQSPSFRAQNGYVVRQQPDMAQGVAIGHEQQPMPVLSLDGTALSRVLQKDQAPEHANNGSSAQWNTNVVSQDAIPQSIKKRQAPELSKEEQHNKARAAISEFISAGITYQNLVDEGIKPPVLNQLFAELGIERGTEYITSKQAMQDSAVLTQSSTRNASADANPQQPQNTRQATSTPQPTVLDPAMERKDRIAQLLAMKKGQAVASAKSPQSASPAPADTSPWPTVKSAPATAQPSAAQQTQQLAVDTTEVGLAGSESNTRQQPQSTVAAVNEFNWLPNPVREERKQQGFSIPGLFLTSADESDLREPLTPVPMATESKSLKRSAEPFSTNAMPQPKRQVSQAMARAQETNNTNASIMAVSPDAPPSSRVSQQTPKLKEIPASSDSDMAIDNGVPASRPKINQDKLKNRMAALKADLLRKNTRKQALQDGMPVLNAEVEKTRERLLEQQSRLSIVRKDIEVKTAELVAAREEEAIILQEIRRLERQLADGESGQEKFSHELTQLNDQIVEDQKASTISPQATTRSSPQAESTEPQPEVLNQDAQMEVETEVTTTTEPLDTHSEPRVAHETLWCGGETNLRAPSYDRQQTETEYSPEQDDLDRQLNFQMATSAAHEQEIVDAPQTATDDEVGVDQQELFDGRSEQKQLNNTFTPSEDQSADDSDDDRMSIDEASDAESDGSASMSDGSDDYEPAAEVQDAQPIETEDNDEYNPEKVAEYLHPAEADNDDYEPAEEVDILNVDALNSLRKESEVPASSLPEQHLTENADRSSHLHSPRQTVINGSAISDRPVVDDLELPLNSGPATDDERLPLQQPTQPPSDVLYSTSDMLQPDHVDKLPEEEALAAARFKPYQSPLSSLKSFRFHPQFNEVVKNGYRSLTYSNRIDAGKPVCPTELEGQMCMDAKCEEQHFGNMALSDDKILVQMSSANDFKDKDLRDAYLLGLKKVIADLREQGVKEFSEVANALSKHRREWMAAQDGLLI